MSVPGPALTFTGTSTNALNELLVQVMALMVIAGDDVSDAKVEQVLRAIGETPVLRGISNEQAAVIFDRSFALVRERGLNEYFAEMRRGLADYAERLLAFALAVQVCFADGAVADEELALLKTFQIEFGLRDLHVAHIVDAVQRGAKIDAIIQDLWEQSRSARPSREEALIEVMLLMAAADGEVQSAEASQLAMMIAQQPEFQSLSEQQIDAAIRGGLTRLQSDGAATRLSVLSRLIADRASRLRALRFAYTILVADGVVAKGETQCLHNMLRAFEIDLSEIDEVLSPATAR